VGIDNCQHVPTSVQQKSSRGNATGRLSAKTSIRLRGRTRSRRRRRGGGVGPCVAAAGDWRGCLDPLLGFFRTGRRIYHGGVVLSFLLSGGSWSNFGFLLARSEKRGAGQNAD
jgi:hypothetical protein